MTGTPSESGNQTGGNPVTPIAGTSQTGGDSTSAEQVTITKAEFDALRNTVETLKSEDRSSKDRAVKSVNERLGRLEESVNPLLERAAKFMQDGDSPQEAIRKANSEYEDAETRTALRELATAWKSGALLNQGAGTTNDNSVSVAKAFEAIGLDPKDPRVAVALTKRYESPDQVELAAYRLQRDLAQSPNPTPAQNASLQGGSAQGSAASLDAVYQQYEQAFKEPTKNADLLKSLEAQMKSLGG